MKNKSIYVVYKTTNIINKELYVGVHKTYNLDNDCYYGSGKRLLASINKYGKLNFEREILFIYHSHKVAYQREKYIVNTEFLKREDTLNLKLGGYGGWHHCNTPEAISKFIEKYGSRNGHMMKPEIRKKAVETGRRNGNYNMDQCRTPEAIIKIRESKKLNGTLYPSHLFKKEVYLKSLETRKKNGTLTPVHCNTKESRLKCMETRRKNVLLKFPEYSAICKLYSPLDEVIKECTIIEMSEFMHGYGRAKECSPKIINRIGKSPMINGKWKGYYIR